MKKKVLLLYSSHFDFCAEYFIDCLTNVNVIVIIYNVVYFQYYLNKEKKTLIMIDWIVFVIFFNVVKLVEV